MDGQTQTSIRTGRQDFLLRRRERGDRTPWSEIPPVQILQDLPPFEVGLYKDRFNYNNEPIENVIEDEHIDNQEMKDIENDLIKQNNHSRTTDNKRNISEDDLQNPTESKNIAIEGMEEEEAAESDDDNNESTGAKAVLNSTPIPKQENFHTMEQQHSQGYAPETTENQPMGKYPSIDQNYIPPCRTSQLASTTIQKPDINTQLPTNGQTLNQKQSTAKKSTKKLATPKQLPTIPEYKQNKRNNLINHGE